VGLDNCEKGFPASLFKEHFTFARQNGLKVTAHAGEEVEYVNGMHSITEAVLSGAMRIDHGVAILCDQELYTQMQQVDNASDEQDNRIALTVCPCSNLSLQNKYIHREAENKWRVSRDNLLKLSNSNLLVTINSDDPA